jgi:fluoride exporter
MRGKIERRWSSPEPSGNGLITPGRCPAPRSFFVGGGGAEEQGGEVRIALLIVFGAVGTLARYGLQGLVQHRTGSNFPSGTLVVNLIGCFLLGGIAQYGLLHLSLPPEWRIGITVGFFGAFTTFSTFSWEAVHLLEDGEWSRAFTYVMASVVGGLLAVILGMRLADRI